MNRLKGSMLKVMSLLVLLTLPPAEGAWAQSVTGVDEGKLQIKIDHLKIEKDGDKRAQGINVANGQLIEVTVDNTCADDFSYEIEKVPALPAPALPPAAPGCSPAPHVVSWSHDDKYGGYILHVKKKNSGSPVKANTSTGQSDLHDFDLILGVNPGGVGIATAGGFTISSLTDPAYGVIDRDGKKYLVRDRKAEDDTRLGVAAFVHVFANRRPEIAASFGLGINEENKTSYFTGASWRWGDKGALTVGYNWGSVKRLPAGVKPSETEPVADATVLNNLGSRVGGNWFFALSYGFLEAGKFLKKPFAGENSAPATSQSGQGAKPAAPGAPAVPAVPVVPSDPCAQSSSSLAAAGAIQADEKTSDHVHLKWDAVKGAKSYVLLISPNQCDDPKAKATERTPTEFNDQDVLPQDKRHYQLRAKDDTGCGPKGPCLDVNVPAANGGH